MKAIYFIKWLWNKSVAEVKSWDRWQWAWMLTCGVGTNAIMFRDENPNWFAGVLIVTTAFWVGYAMIYTGIKKAYSKFQAEQDNILNHLKDSK
jgi:putative Mn2+ efflux pump MntP